MLYEAYSSMASIPSGRTGSEKRVADSCQKGIGMLCYLQVFADRMTAR